MQRSFEDAEENGYFVICDRQRRYPEVPLRIIQGYALVGEEIASQLPQAPTHLFVPGGSGKLASAVCARLWERYGAAHPRVVTVEPEDSACLRESALAGRAVEVGATQARSWTDWSSARPAPTPGRFSGKGPSPS